MLSTVRKCQTVCRQMDVKCGIVPREIWYWPPQKPKENLESDEDGDEDEVN